MRGALVLAAERDALAADADRSLQAPLWNPRESRTLKAETCDLLTLR
jgi:hypothetical protein